MTEGESITIDTCTTMVTNPGTGYVNWADGEPNNSNNENYGEIIFPGSSDDPNDLGKWNDIPSSNPASYLIEVDKLITSLSGHTYLGQYDGPVSYTHLRAHET